MNAAAFFQERNVAIEGAAVIVDFAEFESALDFSNAAFNGVLRCETDAVANLLKGDPIVAAVGIFDVFDASLRNLHAGFFGKLCKREAEAIVPNVKDFAAERVDGRGEGLDESFWKV